MQNNILCATICKRSPLFEGSWTAADEEQMASVNAPFVLNDGTTRADFVAQVAAMDALRDEVDRQVNNMVLGLNQRESARALAVKTMAMFRAAANYHVGGTPLGAQLPTLPGTTEALAKTIRALEAASDRWELIDAVAPMTTRDGTTRAGFVAQITALEAARNALEIARDALPIERARRDEAAALVYATMTRYRAAVLAEFEEKSPVFEVLPTLQHARKRKPKASPEPVVIEVEPTSEESLEWGGELGIGAALMQTARPVAVRAPVKRGKRRGRQRR